MTDPQPDNQTTASRTSSPSSASTSSSATSGNPGAAVSVNDAAEGNAAKSTDPAASLVDQLKESALAAAGGQKDAIAARIDDLAKAVHKSGEQFEGQQDWIAGAIERGADELSSLATAVRQNDLASLLGKVQALAKRQPALFIGASLAAGFAVARLGKLVVSDLSRDDLPTLPEVGHGQH